MNKDKPELSVIIPWSNRPVLQETLPRNRRVFDRHNLEIIIVNCGGDEVQLRELLREHDPARFNCLKIETSVFNKPLALNIGVSASRSPHLFFLDADVILREDFLPSAFEAFNAGHFVTVDRVVESHPRPFGDDNQLYEMAYSISFVAKNGRKAHIETNRVRFTDGSRSAPGLVLIAREHFLAVDGMNSDLEGWGWEDNDLLLRLQFALNLTVHRTGSALHLTHGDEERNWAGIKRGASEKLNFAACLKNYRAGHYFGTYRNDVAMWKDRCRLERLP